MLIDLFASGIILLDTGLVLFLAFYLADSYLSLGPLSPIFNDFLDLLSRFYREAGLILSSITVLGSLYMSKILQLPPCELCWYQRLFIFPLPVLLTVSLVMKRKGVADYVISLAALGIPLSAYHYMVQMTQASTSCSTAISCDSVQIQKFGFVTVPWMSLTFFLSVIVLMLLGYRE